jgi:hypothetical protein
MDNNTIAFDSIKDNELPEVKSAVLQAVTEQENIFHSQSKEQSQVVDMDKELWSTETIVDELTISLLDTTAVFCMINSNKGVSDRKWVEEANRCNNGNGVLRRLYEQQAIYKMYRMPIYRPPPVFVVYLKHLDYRLKQEIAKLDKWSKDYVMKEAIGRIFKHVDRRFYFLSAKPLLEWRLEN